jgi:Fe2+ transport system protein FeoA
LIEVKPSLVPAGAFLKIALSLLLTPALRLIILTFVLNKRSQDMCLSDMRRGEWARVTAIPDADLRVQLLRFGIADGCRVCCQAKLPFGPLVLRYGGQEIAVGRQLARAIQVEGEGSRA